MNVTSSATTADRSMKNKEDGVPLCWTPDDHYIYESPPLTWREIASMVAGGGVVLALIACVVALVSVA